MGLAAVQRLHCEEVRCGLMAVSKPPLKLGVAPRRGWPLVEELGGMPVKSLTQAVRFLTAGCGCPCPHSAPGQIPEMRHNERQPAYIGQVKVLAAPPPGAQKRKRRMPAVWHRTELLKNMPR